MFSQWHIMTCAGMLGVMACCQHYQGRRSSGSLNSVRIQDSPDLRFGQFEQLAQLIALPVHPAFPSASPDSLHIALGSTILTGTT